MPRLFKLIASWAWNASGCAPRGGDIAPPLGRELECLLAPAPAGSAECPGCCSWSQDRARRHRGSASRACGTAARPRAWRSLRPRLFCSTELVAQVVQARRKRCWNASASAWRARVDIYGLAHGVECLLVPAQRVQHRTEIVQAPRQVGLAPERGFLAESMSRYRRTARGWPPVRLVLSEVAQGIANVVQVAARRGWNSSGFR